MLKRIMGVCGFVMTAMGGEGMVHSSSATERYFCVGDAATGFSWRDGKWQSRNFNVDDDKYFVEETIRLSDNLGPYFAVKRIGRSYAEYLNCIKEDGEIGCSVGRGGFKLNIETLRFMQYYTYGYLDGDDSGATPNITIGECTKLE